MSRAELAEAVNAFLWKNRPRSGATVTRTPSGGIDAGYVGKLERGLYRWPGRDYREAFGAVLGVADPADLGFFINRRPALRPAQTAAECLVRPRPSSPGARLSVIEWDEVLAHLREQWHGLVRADNLLGPRHALAGVQAQLDVLTNLMATGPSDQRALTVRLAAQYAESAAWLQQDTGDLDLARFWTGQAMEWAYETGDDVMVAWSAYRRSQQLTATGRPFPAISLAQAARRDEDRLPTPMRAAVRVQEAHALAAIGSDGTALQLLDVAHRWAATDEQGDARAGHGSFCTPGYIEVHRATCLRLTGRPAEAIAVYEQALPTIPAVYRRDKAAALTGKAAAHAAAGEPDLAAATAHEALPVARRAGSLRIVRQIATVGAALQPHRRLEPVAALLADLAGEA